MSLLPQLRRVPPDHEDRGMVAILTGLVRASGARACRLRLQMEPRGSTATYSTGAVAGAPSRMIRVEGDRYSAVLELFGAVHAAAGGPAALEALGPLLAAALAAVIECSNLARQSRLMAEILGVASAASLVLDRHGALIYTSPRATSAIPELVDCPPELRDDDARAQRGIELLRDEVVAMRSSGERTRRRTVAGRENNKWRVEITELPGLAADACSFVVLTPLAPPSAEEIQAALAAYRISPRQAEVLAHAFRGARACDIARSLGITEYTVKDHLKHAYARLGVRSRAQLLARFAGTAAR